LYITLVIYKESLHNARSTKCKIILACLRMNFTVTLTGFSQEIHFEIYIFTRTIQ